MSGYIAARIVGEPQAATGLNEFTSEGSGWRRKPEPRKACFLWSGAEQKAAKLCKKIKSSFLPTIAMCLSLPFVFKN